MSARPMASYDAASNICRALARGFSTKTEHGVFKFDTGPSFFAGLSTPNALNPLAAILTLLGEPLDTVKYDPLGTFHLEAGKPGLKRHADLSKLVTEVRRFSPAGATQLHQAVPKIRTMYGALSGLPTPALRADWQVGPPESVPVLATSCTTHE